MLSFWLFLSAIVFFFGWWKHGLTLGITIVFLVAAWTLGLTRNTNTALTMAAVLIGGYVLVRLWPESSVTAPVAGDEGTSVATRPRRVTERWRVSVHEAAHYLRGLQAGMRNVFGKFGGWLDDFAGMVSADDLDGFSERRPWEMVQFWMTGGAAERKLLGTDAAGSGHDLSWAREWCKKFGFSFNAAMREAEDWSVANQRQIFAYAEEMDRKGWLRHRTGATAAPAAATDSGKKRVDLGFGLYWPK